MKTEKEQRNAQSNQWCQLLERLVGDILENIWYFPWYSNMFIYSMISRESLVGKYCSRTSNISNIPTVIFVLFSPQIRNRNLASRSIDTTHQLAYFTKWNGRHAQKYEMFTAVVQTQVSAVVTTLRDLKITLQSHDITSQKTVTCMSFINLKFYYFVCQITRPNYCSYVIYIYIYIKVKYALEQATKVQRGSRGIDLLFL